MANYRLVASGGGYPVLLKCDWDGTSDGEEIAEAVSWQTARTQLADTGQAPGE